MLKTFLAIILASTLGVISLMVLQAVGGIESFWQIIDTILAAVGVIFPILEFIVGMAIPIIFPIGQMMTGLAQSFLALLPQNALIYQISGIAIIIIGAILNFMKPERIERI
jgi:hypothetical protein